MGAVAKAIGSLLGTTKPPKTDVSAATSQVDDELAKTKAAKAALLETYGGQAGSQLQPGQVQSSNTLFGN